MHHIHQIIQCASHAYDLDILKQTFILKALIHIFFDDYLTALQDFMKVRCIADELEDLHMKMETYESMGKCYQ